MMNLEKSKATLEYDKILLQIAEYAHTEGAKEKIKNLKPAVYPEIVKKLLNQTTDAKKMAAFKGAPVFGSVKYVGDSVERAFKGAVLTPAELLNIGGLYRAARGLLNYHRSNKNFDTSIDELFERLFANRALEDKIFRAIISEDMIADEASPALADIRRKIRHSNEKVRENLQKYISGNTYSKYLQENIITMRNGRYVIPLKTEHKNEIKGLVHDTSSSGATLFIEPLAVVEINNEIKILERNERDEIERILAELSDNCAGCADEINLNYENITEIAVIFAKSEYSFKIDGICPKIVDRKGVYFHRARHPLIEKSSVVPIDIGIGDGYDTLVITGPNTGGKTVSLKTLGLFIMMAQTGIHVPCSDQSYMSIFEDVLADIGDEQSIEQSLSTFSAHMVNIIKILDNVTPNTIVLFDELGSGTDPVEGAALAIAILEKVHSVGALCTATTHYAELKVYALETEYARNASCEFDIETLKPTYKLTIGTPGRSNAFAISQKLGLPFDIIERAESLVKSENKKFETVVGKLEENRLELEKEKKLAAKIRHNMEIKNAVSEKALQKKIADAEKNLEKSREEAKRIIASSRATSNYIFAELEKLQKQKDAENFKQTLSEMKSAIKSSLKAADDDITPKIENINPDDDDIDYELPRPLQKGDSVLIRDANLVGIVETPATDKDGNVQIKSGAIKIKTKLSNLRLVDADYKLPENKKSGPANKYRNIKQSGGDMEIKSLKTEIDVRGQNGEDAWFMVDKFIDSAKMHNITNLRVIHGKGTGALRTALWRFFKTDRRITSFRMGQYGEGDAGVTVVELK